MSIRQIEALLKHFPVNVHSQILAYRALLAGTSSEARRGDLLQERSRHSTSRNATNQIKDDAILPAHRNRISFVKLIRDLSL